MFRDPGLLQDTQEVIALLDRSDLVGRLIAQLLPAMRKRGDRLAEPLLLIERQRIGVGFCNPLDGRIELVELPFGLRQDVRALRRRKIECDCGEIDKALRSLVNDIAGKLHVRDGLLDLGDAGAQVPKLQYAKRHRNRSSTECQGHRPDKQQLDVGKALHFLTGARKNDLRFQSNVAARRKVLVNSGLHGDHGVADVICPWESESPHIPKFLQKMASKPTAHGSTAHLPATHDRDFRTSCGRRRLTGPNTDYLSSYSLKLRQPNWPR